MRARFWLLATIVILGGSWRVHAQTPTSDGPITKDTSVGYIDSAIPQSMFRLRYDSAYNSNRPTRDEFFYAKYQSAGGPGLPGPEKRVDYQDISAYLEGALSSRFSVFTEIPMRFLNPDINDNHAGLSDMTAGFKFAFWQDELTTATLYFRTFAPTGNAHSGLGTNHVSFEQGILVNRKLNDWLTSESEARIWVPVGGTDYAGSVLRYGTGLAVGRRSADSFWVTPVVEVIGWTSLGGQELAFESPTSFAAQSANGDTIVNGKLGARFGVGCRYDVYAGYGRALTGDVWYKDIFRLEARWKF